MNELFDLKILVLIVINIVSILISYSIVHLLFMYII